MHGWYGGGWGPGASFVGFPWGGAIMGIIGLALIALLIVAIVRFGRLRRPDSQDSKERGIDILIERYTRGEIDAETFRTMKAELDAKI